MTKKPQHGLLQEYSQRAQEALKIKIKFLYAAPSNNIHPNRNILWKEKKEENFITAIS